MHALSEAKRLHQRDASSDGSVALNHQQVQAARKELARRTLIVLAGHVGSGVVSIGTQLRAQLEERLGKRSRSLRTVLIDLSHFSLEKGGSSPSDQLKQFLSSRVQYPRGETSDSVLVILTLSAAVHCRLPELLSALSVLLSATLVSVLSVVAPASVQFDSGIAGGYVGIVIAYILKNLVMFVSSFSAVTLRNHCLSRGMGWAMSPGRPTCCSCSSRVVATPSLP